VGGSTTPKSTPPPIVEVIPPHSKKNTAAATSFDQWWREWTAVMHAVHRTEAEHAWRRYVTETNLNMAFQCTRSYLASRAPDQNGGYFPQNFLQKMARDDFTGRWKAWKRPITKEEIRFQQGVAATRFLRGEK
jgi:hypothetical protein